MGPQPGRGGQLTARRRSPRRRPRRSARSAITASAWRPSRRGSASRRPPCTATTRASTTCSGTRCSTWASSWWTPRRSRTRPTDDPRRPCGDWSPHHRHRAGQPGVRRALPLGGRYLRGDDQATLNVRCERSTTGSRAAHGELRPELTSRQRWMLSTSRDRQHRRPSRQAARHPIRACWPTSRRDPDRRSAGRRGRCREPTARMSPSNRRNTKRCY